MNLAVDITGQRANTYTLAVAALLETVPKARQWFDGKRGKMAAREFIGLSKNSKMPSWTFAIPAREACPRGGKLAKIEGTVCHGCYAAKGLDGMPIAQVAKARRWDTVKACLDNPLLRAAWIEAFAVAMKGEDYFRWHSAGDLFSDAYAELVRDCILATPWIDHWIPTREQRYASLFADLSNVVYRVSDDMVDQASNKHKGNTSGVHTGQQPSRGQECIARFQDGECRDCRACWSADVTHISYHLH